MPNSAGHGSINYVTVAHVVGIYDAAMQESGHPPAALLREVALDGAVHHPRQLGYYEGADLIEQAVDLMARIALAHAWADGNTRVAVHAFEVFLALNGIRSPSSEAYVFIADALVAFKTGDSEERATMAGDLVARIRAWP